MARPKFSYKEYSEQLEQTLAGVRAKNRALKAELKALKAQLPEILPTDSFSPPGIGKSAFLTEFTKDIEE